MCVYNVCVQNDASDFKLIECITPQVRKIPENCRESAYFAEIARKAQETSWYFASVGRTEWREEGSPSKTPPSLVKSAQARKNSRLEGCKTPRLAGEAVAAEALLEQVRKKARRFTECGPLELLAQLEAKKWPPRLFRVAKSA